MEDPAACHVHAVGRGVEKHRGNHRHAHPVVQVLTEVNLLRERQGKEKEKERKEKNKEKKRIKNE